MRKLPTSLENPLDTMMVDLADAMNPFLLRTGHTPNVLTTYSAVSSVLALRALWGDNMAHFTFWWALRVFWDNADGNFARAYNMETRLGDWYDHINDNISGLLLAFIVWKKYNVPLWIALTVLGVLATFMVHMGCQQRYANTGKGETLDALMPCCGSVSWLRWTRWLGHGTLHLLVIVVVWYLHARCKR